MSIPEKNRQTNDEREKSKTTKVTSTNDAVEDDGSPVLDEKDLDENDLTIEEADNIEWEEPKKSDNS